MTLPTTKTQRMRYDGLETALSLQLDAAVGQSTIQFEDVLTSDGGKPVPALEDHQYITLSILDALYVLKEIVYLIEYDGVGGTGTITRGEEGTDPWTHTAGTKVVHASTANDFQVFDDHLNDPNAHWDVINSIATQRADEAVRAHEAKPDPHPQYAMKGDINVAANEDLDVYGDLIIHEGARLIVHGDLLVENTGRFFINGRQLIIDDVEPVAPANNIVWIRTFGETP